jgi:hypothetical protein
VLALSVAVATALALVPASVAIGPGGWSRVGHGSTVGTASLNGHVTALNSDNPGALYVGGNFTNAGGHANADRIAKWNGTSWSAIGGTPLGNGQVFAIAYLAGKVYVGGTFVDAGGDPLADHLAVWNPGTATWESPCTTQVPNTPAFSGNVKALQIIGNTLWVGGEFQNGAAIARADYLVGCDLTTRTPIATVGSDGAFSGPVYALAPGQFGSLYAGGGFNITDANPVATNVANYDSTGVWHALGSGPGGAPAVNTFVRSLHYINGNGGTGNLFVGTDAINVAGLPQADHIARWDGNTWNVVGWDTAGTNGWFANGFTIDALASYGTVLFAAGSFQNANGTATADDIAYFDGTWHPIGSNGAGNGPLSQHPAALAVMGGKVYVGGSFTSAGGDSLAKFLAAYALRQPDVGISPTSNAGPVSGYSTGPFLGMNRYSATGSGEVRTVTVTRGHTVRCYIKIQNDGLVPVSFKIKGTGSATGFTPHYFRDGQSLAFNITAGVRDGTYATVSLDPRDSVVIRFEVKVGNSSASKATFTTTARTTAGTVPDAVRLVVKATG